MLRSLQAVDQLRPSAFEPLRETYQVPTGGGGVGVGVGVAVGVGVGAGVGVGVGLGVGVGVGVGVVPGVGVGVVPGVGVGVVPGVGVGVGAGVGVGEKIGGSVGRTGKDGAGVGVGVGLLLCDGLGVGRLVGEAMATPPCVPLGEVAPLADVDALGAETDCCGPSHRNSKKQTISVVMMARRLNIPLHRPVHASDPRNAIRKVTPVVNGVVAERNQPESAYSIPYDEETDAESIGLTP